MAAVVANNAIAAVLFVLARKEFGAVGCPQIHTVEEKQAWNNYVRETAAHFKGRVEYYEVRNEPDGKWCSKCARSTLTDKIFYHTIRHNIRNKTITRALGRDI